MCHSVHETLSSFVHGPLSLFFFSNIFRHYAQDVVRASDSDLDYFEHFSYVRSLQGVSREDTGLGLW